VRKFALIPLLLIALALGLAACGGGGSSSSGGSAGSGSSGNSEEAAWAKEVATVISHFENNTSAQMVESISTASSQPLLEPLYHTYGGFLTLLAEELEATKAPEECVAAREKIVDAGRKVASLNKALGEQDKLSQEEFSLLVEKQGVKIRKAGQEFTKLVADPSC
jgi:hypothetical protein